LARGADSSADHLGAATTRHTLRSVCLALSLEIHAALFLRGTFPNRGNRL